MHSKSGLILRKLSQSTTRRKCYNCLPGKRTTMEEGGGSEPTSPFKNNFLLFNNCRKDRKTEKRKKNVIKYKMSAISFLIFLHEAHSFY